ncbi:MAG TPA: TIGR00299 family protein, partial [Treponema sp.]|nr:TIGR00299 family protein [Treponema sp.]
MKDNEALYFECESGISGDMAVAALLDVGADQTVLQKALDSIPAHGFTTRISRVNKGGVSCCDFDVILDAEHENHDHDMEYLFGHEHHHDDD